MARTAVHEVELLRGAAPPAGVTRPSSFKDWDARPSSSAGPRRLSGELRPRQGRATGREAELLLRGRAAARPRQRQRRRRRRAPSSSPSFACSCCCPLAPSLSRWEVCCYDAGRLSSQCCGSPKAETPLLTAVGGGCEWCRPGCG
jgi:hypothetical protein